MKETIEIEREEYEKLINVATAAGVLSSRFMPKVNYGASCLDADAIVAMNGFIKRFGILSNERMAGKLKLVIKEFGNGIKYYR